MSKASDIEQKASEWLILSESGRLTPELRIQRERWLNKDLRHRAAYTRLKEAWQRANGMKNARQPGRNEDPDILMNEAVIARIQEEAEAAQARRNAQMLIGVLLALAACILLYALNAFQSPLPGP